MSRVRCALAACLAGLLLAVATPTLAAAPDCDYSLADVAAAPRFEDYPVAIPRPAPPAKPRLASRDAREFATAIRQAAAAGPNFAGRFALAVWGCGSACNDFAIIDARSGRVFFDPGLRAISVLHVDPGREPNGSLRFRPDSRLLVILGAPAEDDARDGVAFYEWTGTALKLLRFAARASICAATDRPQPNIMN